MRVEGDAVRGEVSGGVQEGHRRRLPFQTSTRMSAALVGLVALMVLVASGSGREGTLVEVEVPAGSTLPDIARILESHDVIGSAGLFHAYVRLRRADRDLKAGRYQMVTESSMGEALRTLRRGEVATVAVTIPEGFQLQQMAERLSDVVGLPADAVLATLRAPWLLERHDVPGPGLEGYLFPDTYRFAEGISVERVVDAMVARYRQAWTPERRARLEASGLTEREVVTLASIIQAEARHVEEMPRIGGVYRNRLDRGWRLEADPTVLYALGGYRARLLYAAIDSVRDDPYNTYGNAGLPPGPIGSPGEAAIDAALTPEDHDFMFFVAWPDGTHVFTTTLAEHNAAKASARRAREGA